MSFFRTLLMAPLSWIYGGVISLRHTMFDWKLLKSEEFDIPIVCVGNLAVGGTGKTPHTEYLIGYLNQHYNIAVLSRGYKRKTKGFYLAQTTSSFKNIGDEPKQIKLKFPNIPVAVCEKRVVGIRKIRQAHPEVNLIILDDAFQHRYVDPWLNILLMDYNHPIYEDHLLPWGRLRDKPSQINRAQIVIATKCPTDLRPLDYRMVHKYLELLAFQNLYFTRFHSADPTPLFPDLDNPSISTSTPVIAMAGIANPTKFVERIEKRYNLIGKLLFPDHYTFKMSDIAHLEQILRDSPPNTAVFLTEKDAVKLMGSKKISEDVRRRLFYISINVEFLNDGEEDFLRQVDKYVQKNHKHSL